MKQRILIQLTIAMLSIACHGQTYNDTNVVAHHNKIDDINDAKQIKALIKSIDKDYARFKINTDLKFSDKDCQRLCDSLKTKSYIKADFDNNGYTDLLVIGQWDWGDPLIVCILGSGKNKFTINRFTRGIFQDCSFPVVRTEGKETFIEYYFFKQSDDWRKYDSTRIIQSKKLIYKFGDFVEYNSLPRAYNIKKIAYSTTMCFGTCPVFNLTINSDRTAKYEGIKFNEPDGEFSGIINKDDYKELVDLLNYIDFPKLDNNYSVGWTDDQTCTLTITYDDGKTKTITDYGKIGTYGLDRLYNILFKLRESRIWY